MVFHQLAIKNLDTKMPEYDTAQASSAPGAPARELTGLWPRQFDPAFDFPTTAISKKFALATTPRCGSHFLGHQLHGMGAFGYPLEYFNPANWRVWGRRAGGAGSTLSYIQSVRTGPNGVFSTKLHQEHLALFLDKETDALTYKFIHLQRRDLLRQAISFSRAQQTGAWISDMPETSQAKYDWQMISQKLDEISLGNANWRSFFTSIGAEPLNLFYEDIAADPISAINQITEFLEIDSLDAQSATSNFEPQRQHGQTNDGQDWAARYISDCQRRIARSELISGVRQSGSAFAPRPGAGALARAYLRKIRTPK